MNTLDAMKAQNISPLERTKLSDRAARIFCFMPQVERELGKSLERRRFSRAGGSTFTRSRTM